VYEFEAAELIRLRKAGLLTDSFQQPLPYSHVFLLPTGSSGRL
jgi:hypothetical protein